MNYEMTLETFIKIKFGTQNKLGEALEVGQNTVNRWYNQDPKKFFTHVQQLSKWGDVPVAEVVEMIEKRCTDVRHLQADRK